MAQASPSPRSSSSPTPAGSLTVRLEVHASTGPAGSYPVGPGGFLLGSVPGCDLRLPGTHLPPVVALLGVQADAVHLRKLAPMSTLLLNGQSVSQATLQDGDRLTVGKLELVVFISGSVPAPTLRLAPTPEPEGDLDEFLLEQARLLDEREQQLLEQTQELETDRAIWYQRRQAIEAECLEQQQSLATLQRELTQREQHLNEEQANLASQRHQLGQQEAELIRVRQEMASIRRQLVDRYRQRRERLEKQQEGVRRAGRLLQEQKRTFESDLAQARALRGNEQDTRTELATLAGELTQRARQLQQQQAELETRETTLRAELSRRESELAERERRLTSEQDSLHRHQTQYHTDLVRLDRLAATLEQRQKQLQKHALEIDRRFETLQRDSRDLEEQATQLDEWHAQLTAKAEDNEQKQREVEAGRAELAARTAALEGQQATLATLRMKLERLREDHRRQEQALTEQRVAQQEAENEIQQRLQEARQFSAEILADREFATERQRQYEERRATLESAVVQLREAQEQLARETEHLHRREAELNSTLADQQEQSALVQARASELEQSQERLRLDRQALTERAAMLTRAEQVLATLQEQIRRRSDELTERVKALEQQEQVDEQRRREIEAQAAALDATRRELEELQSSTEENWQTRLVDLRQREQEMQAGLEELTQARQSLAEERAGLETERANWANDCQQTTLALQQARAEVDTLREEASTLFRQLPELEARGEATLERVSQARDQLREGVAEVHAYVRQSREELDRLQLVLRSEREQLREQQHTLARAQDEHRLAVAAFRQEVIDWQVRITELKQDLLQSETRIDRRQAEIEEQAQQVAVQAQHLVQQQRAVDERRQEVDRHLDDMREWYRRKLRELARTETPDDPDQIRPTILGVTGDVETGDRNLGELLRSLELVDADTLTALLAEARRQRKSLRQLLLAGNYLTLFQMALIEAGNLDALVLGPVRVIDRLHSTSREAIYRVFDPRANREVLLRHLAESEMHDAVRPDEFRQRFAAASTVRHPHLASTYEVLEIAGRPAILQEWLIGQVSTDWPALAAVPGVWFRLLSQAAVGLQAAHLAGLIHGHLHLGQILMTTDSLLKIGGFGEPSWLALEAPPDLPDPSPLADLLALGQCALTWANPPTERKGPRTRPLPDSLQHILQRLCGEAGTEPYPDVAALLDELDAAGSAVPPNAAAWERFCRQVREQSIEAPLRRAT